MDDSDPRWAIPTHSQQHPSDTSFHPDSSSSIIASKGGRYKVVAGSSADSQEASWIDKSQATQEMVRQWRAGRQQRDEVRQRRRGEKRKRSAPSESESDASDDGPSKPRAKRNPPPESSQDDDARSLHFGVSPYVQIDRIQAGKRDDAPVYRGTATQSTQEVEAESLESEMAPMRPLPLEAFAPFLDDTTGLIIDAEGRPQMPRLRKVAQRSPQDDSSPVDQFSPSLSPEYAPQDVPRVGSWIIPKPPRRRSRQREEALSQLRMLIDSDDEFSASIFESQVLQSSQPPRVEEQRQPTPPAQPTPVETSIHASQPSMVETQPPSRSQPRRQPRESTPSRLADTSLPSQRIPSPPASSLLAEIEKTPSRPMVTQSQPLPNTSASDTSHSSQGWATLPRREIVELVSKSTHIPAFLKEELEKWVLRAKRASNSQRSSGAPSSSQSQETSEMLEDGFLRTKKVWCFDLLVARAGVGATGFSEEAGRTMSQTSASASQGRTVVLLVDTSEGTFDVHEVEDNLADVMRKDVRYSPWFDAEGKMWPSLPAVPAAPAVDHAAEVRRLTAAIAASEAARSKAEKERDQAKEDSDFIRSLYDRASSSAAAAQAEAEEATARAETLQLQLTEGLATHREMAKLSAERLKADKRALEGQLKLLKELAFRTDKEELRSKAALWDAHQATQEALERERLARIKANKEKRAKLIAELGGEAAVVQRIETPHVVVVNRDPSPLDEMDELAALAAEAAEAGEDIQANMGRGGRRRRAAAVEAANLASSTAAEQASQEIQDQLAQFASSTSAPLTQP